MLPGEMFGLSHFVTEADGTFPFDHPKASEVLQRGEAASFFPADSFRVLHDEVVRDSDAGRPLVNFVVVRVAK